MSHFFDQFRHKKVLVVGDAMIDRYLWGSVDRISPEAPVPVLKYTHEESKIGGAANVALNTQNLGVQTALCSIVGDDENGKILRELIDRNHIRTDFLYSSPTRCTSVKTRVLSGQQHLLRVDKEDTHVLSQKEADEVRKKFDLAVNSFQPDVIILQDYNKGLFTSSFISHCIEASQRKGIFIAVDPKLDHFFEYKEVDLFKPNFKEISQAFQISGKANDPVHLKNLSDKLLERIDYKNLLVTLSSEGVFWRKEDHFGIVPTQKREIVDVCGAGDAVISIASLAMACGLSLSNVAKLSNIAGGQACEKVGVTSLVLENLRSEWEDKETTL